MNTAGHHLQQIGLSCARCASPTSADTFLRSVNTTFITISSKSTGTTKGNFFQSHKISGARFTSVCRRSTHLVYTRIQHCTTGELMYAWYITFPYSPKPGARRRGSEGQFRRTYPGPHCPAFPNSLSLSFNSKPEESHVKLITRFQLPAASVSSQEECNPCVKVQCISATSN